MNLFAVGQTVRVDIADSDTDYDHEFVEKYHNKVGTLIEIAPQVAGETLYTVDFPTLAPADFAKTDLVIRP